MFKRVSFFIINLLLVAFAAMGASSAFAARPGVEGENTLVILCYHDVADSLEKADLDVVSTKDFSAQMLWLKNNGYSVISVQDYIDFRTGKKRLAKKSVMLTFDDGYRSFYTHIFPILRSLRFPSTLAIIGSWENRPVPAVGPFKSPVANAAGIPLEIVTREEIKELSKTGLVEIASHSYDLHHGELANGQGDYLPSAGIQVLAKEYETNEAYNLRLRRDLAMNSLWLKNATGTAPRVMVWPYGRYTTEGLRAAATTGHTISFGLDDSWFLYDGGEVVGRFYVTGNLKLAQFADYVKTAEDRVPARRHVTVQIPSNVVWGPKLDAAWVKNAALSVRSSGANVVLLSPFLAGDSTCKPLVATNATKDYVDVLSTVATNIASTDDVRVVIDVDLTQCPFTAAQWKDLVTSALQLVPNTGLVIRTDQQHAVMAQDLIPLAYTRSPLAITASDIPLTGAAFTLVTVDACHPDYTEVNGANKRLQYEVDTRTCDGTAVLDQFLKLGVRNFGTKNDPLLPSGELPNAGKFQLFGLVGMKPKD